MELNIQLNLGKTNTTHLETKKIYDLIVIGGGPAGLNASLYAKRKGLNVGIITKKVGGQVLNTSLVDNYLGLNHISGEALIEKFVNQVNGLDIPILEDVIVTSINSVNQLHVVTANDIQYQAKTIIIATGGIPRRLNIPGEAEYLGKGVAYCAICDAPLFKGKDVVVAGGGNAAVEAAIDLSKLVKSVILVHRSQLSADKVLIDELLNNPSITVYLQTKIVEVIGDHVMTGIKIEDGNVISSQGLFIEIGTIPNSDFIKNDLSTNDRNEIVVNESNATTTKGIFACGDVTQTPYKQIIIAAAEGAKAALSANDYINKNNN